MESNFQNLLQTTKLSQMCRHSCENPVTTECMVRHIDGKFQHSTIVGSQNRAMMSERYRG